MRPLRDIFSYLLYPFSLLYGLITTMRNRLYDAGLLSEVSFDLPTIAVGNLSVGGSGKTPMVEYLIGLLGPHYRLATLSRGYRRQTRGFVLADQQSDALSIGDEPMQFHRKFPGLAVAVGEERVLAVPELLQERPETEVILLDDAFQHRSIRPGINLLVTDHARPFWNDHVVPFGRLREPRSGYRRADMIVLSKCPPQMPVEERNRLEQLLQLPKGQRLFCSTLAYGQPYGIFDRSDPGDLSKSGVILACGIARPEHLLEQLRERCAEVALLRFPDHYYFTFTDLEKMQDALSQLSSPRRILITTEKDAVRLDMLKTEILRLGLPLYVLPVDIVILFGEAPDFNQRILEYVERSLSEAPTP